MNLLLDTHVLLWWLDDDRRLGRAAREAIADEANLVAVSAASAWEISIKHALGKLTMPDDLVDELEASGFEPMAVTVRHALQAGALPPHHADPFDRMLVAQALLDGLVLVTSDPRLSAYGVGVMAA